MRHLLTTFLMHLAKWVHSRHCEDYDWKYGEHPAARDYMWVYEQQYAPDTGEPIRRTARTCRICSTRQEFSKRGKFNWEFSRNGKTEGAYCEWCGSTENVAGVWDAGAKYNAMCDRCFGRERTESERRYKPGWMPGVTVTKYRTDGSAETA